MKSKKILKKLPRSKSFVLGLKVKSLNKIGDRADKMIELTAAEIASLAFSGAVQATGGALSQTVIAKCKQLWQKIKEKFQENKIVKAAIADAEQQIFLNMIAIAEKKISDFQKIDNVKALKEQLIQAYIVTTLDQRKNRKEDLENQKQNLRNHKNNQKLQTLNNYSSKQAVLIAFTNILIILLFVALFYPNISLQSSMID